MFKSTVLFAFFMLSCGVGVVNCYNAAGEENWVAVVGGLFGAWACGSWAGITYSQSYLPGIIFAIYAKLFGYKWHVVYAGGSFAIVQFSSRRQAAKHAEFIHGIFSEHNSKEEADQLAIDLDRDTAANFAKANMEANKPEEEGYW